MYTVKGIKTFRGMEGQGFNATLCRDGRPVAFVYDDASGGEISIEWKNRGDNRTIDWWNYKGEPMQVSCCGDEAQLYEFLRGRTRPGYLDPTKPEQIDPDEFIADLVWDAVENRRKIRACKTKTLFRLKDDKEGECWTLNRPFTPEVKADLQKKYGDKLVSIINEEVA